MSMKPTISGKIQGVAEFDPSITPILYFVIEPDKSIVIEHDKKNDKYYLPFIVDTGSGPASFIIHLTEIDDNLYFYVVVPTSCNAGLIGKHIDLYLKTTAGNIPDSKLPLSIIDKFRIYQS